MQWWPYQGSHQVGLGGDGRVRKGTFREEVALELGVEQSLLHSTSNRRRKQPDSPTLWISVQTLLGEGSRRLGSWDFSLLRCQISGRCSRHCLWKGQPDLSSEYEWCAGIWSHALCNCVLCLRAQWTTELSWNSKGANVLEKKGISDPYHDLFLCWIWV